MKKLIFLIIFAIAIGFGIYVVKNNKDVSVDTAKEFIDEVKNSDKTKSAIEAGKKAGEKAKEAIHEATK